MRIVRNVFFYGGVKYKEDINYYTDEESEVSDQWVDIVRKYENGSLVKKEYEEVSKYYLNEVRRLLNTNEEKGLRVR